MELLYFFALCLRAGFVQNEQENPTLILLLLVGYVLEILYKIALFDLECLVILAFLTLLIGFKIQNIRNWLLINSKVTVQRNHKFMQLRVWAFTFGLEFIISKFWEVLFGLESDLGESQNVGMGERGLVWTNRQVMQELRVVLLSFLRVDDVVG